MGTLETHKSRISTIFKFSPGHVTSETEWNTRSNSIRSCLHLSKWLPWPQALSPALASIVTRLKWFFYRIGGKKETKNGTTPFQFLPLSKTPYAHQLCLSKGRAPLSGWPMGLPTGMVPEEHGGMSCSILRIYPTDHVGWTVPSDPGCPAFVQRGQVVAVSGLTDNKIHLGEGEKMEMKM